MEDSKAQDKIINSSRDNKRNLGDVFIQGLLKVGEKEETKDQNKKSILLNRIKGLGRRFQKNAVLKVSGTDKKVSNPLRIFSSRMTESVFNEPDEEVHKAPERREEFKEIDEYLLEESKNKNVRFGEEQQPSSNAFAPSEDIEESMSDSISQVAQVDTKRKMMNKRKSIRFKGKRS